MQKKTVDLVHVVTTDVEMKPMSPTSVMKSRAVRQEAEQKNSIKIACELHESHEFIIDEIRRRERLEHDPSRMFVAADEDSKSDKDNEG